MIPFSVSFSLPPATEISSVYVDIAVGSFTCGIRATGTIDCAVNPNLFGGPDPHERRMLDLSAQQGEQHPRPEHEHAWLGDTLDQEESGEQRRQESEGGVGAVGAQVEARPVDGEEPGAPDEGEHGDGEEEDAHGSEVTGHLLPGALGAAQRRTEGDPDDRAAGDPRRGVEHVGAGAFAGVPRRAHEQHRREHERRPRRGDQRHDRA